MGAEIEACKANFDTQDIVQAEQIQGQSAEYQSVRSECLTSLRSMDSKIEECEAKLVTLYSLSRESVDAVPGLIQAHKDEYGSRLKAIDARIEECETKFATQDSPGSLKRYCSPSSPHPIYPPRHIPHPSMTTPFCH